VEPQAGFEPGELTHCFFIGWLCPVSPLAFLLAFRVLQKLQSKHTLIGSNGPYTHVG
jgi:hypothetical protein